MHLNTNAPIKNGLGRVMILFYYSDSYLLVNLALNGRGTGLGESIADHIMLFFTFLFWILILYHNFIR